MWCLISDLNFPLSDSGFFSTSLEKYLPSKDELSVNNVLDRCKTYWTFKYDKQAKSKETQQGKYVSPTLFGYSKCGWNSKTTARNSQTVTAGVAEGANLLLVLFPFANP